jgi:hypothetical protein
MNSRFDDSQGQMPPIQQWFVRLSTRVLVWSGTPLSKVSRQRDVALAVPIAFALLIANAPITLVLDHQPVSGEWMVGAPALLCFAWAASLLSPNWNQVLGAGWAFVAFRWAFAFMVTGSLTVIVVAAGSGLIAIGLTRLKSEDNVT